MRLCYIATMIDMPGPNELTGQGRDRLVRRGLKLGHLRLIAALAETGQISAAARQLAMSQPAASRLLAELDRIAEAALYRRHSRGITLTDSGLAFARWARKLMRDLDAAGRQIAEVETGLRGTVAIGAVTGPAIELVLPVLRQVRVTHPGILSNVTVDTSDKLAELMVAEKLDFYIGRIPQDFDHGLFAAEPVGEEPVSLVVREGHPLLRTGATTLDDCVGYDWVLQAPGGLLRHTVETHLLERGLELPARILSTSSMLMTLALISQSNAIAPVSRAVATFFSDRDGLNARIALLPVATDLAVTAYAMLRPRARTLSPAGQTIWRLIGERVRLRAAETTT